jgi:hypothetical protein
MKKVMILVIAMLVVTGLAMAQTWTGGSYKAGTGIPFNIDKLGAHQNGGRGCVGCHAPHSGARGNGGVLRWNATSGAYESVAVTGQSGDDVLWGQDLGPIYNHPLNFPGSSDYAAGITGDVTIQDADNVNHPRLVTGIAMCLSCHDGNVAKGAMMTNRSFEQAAGLLPASYGSQPIPTLLGADGGSYGNYQNDHPVGTQATLGAVGHGAINAAKGFFALNATKTGITTGATYAGSNMSEFAKNYGLPLTVGSRAGAGFVVETTMTTVDQAYVVCTTCHTPHSMYTTGASATNPIATNTSGTFPTYFFIAAPYNPGADTAGGTRASSASQFCRQCHFSGPGGANEASGISIPTAF